MTTTLTLADEQPNGDNGVLIKVIGVGGGGCNAVKNMLDFDLSHIELICANTDKQALDANPVKHKIQLGPELTKGKGAGCNPDVGKEAAEESAQRLQEALAGAEILFIAAGMGGGTGTGAAPVVAKIAKDMGILTIAIVTKPFTNEGKKRLRMANDGLEALKEQADCLLVIPNDRIAPDPIRDERILEEEKAKMLSGDDAFARVNNVLKDGVAVLANIFQKVGMINIDVQDVRTVMKERGVGMIGIGEAKGEDRARIATERAISSPLLENIDLSRARGILVNITAPSDFLIEEYSEVGNIINALAHDDAMVKHGLIKDDQEQEYFRVTIYATGIEEDELVNPAHTNPLLKDNSLVYPNIDMSPAGLGLRPARPSVSAQADPFTQSNPLPSSSNVAKNESSADKSKKGWWDLLRRKNSD